MCFVLKTRRSPEKSDRSLHISSHLPLLRHFAFPTFTSLSVSTSSPFPSSSSLVFNLPHLSHSLLLPQDPLSSLHHYFYHFNPSSSPSPSSRTVQKQKWTGTSAVPCATCSSPLPSWPSRTTRVKPTPRESAWCWGSQPNCRRP